MVRANFIREIADNIWSSSLTNHFLEDAMRRFGTTHEVQRWQMFTTDLEEGMKNQHEVFVFSYDIPPKNLMADTFAKLELTALPEDSHFLGGTRSSLTDRVPHHAPTFNIANSECFKDTAVF